MANYRTSTEERKQIASAIVAQLGGMNRLIAMVGAKDFVVGEDAKQNVYLGFKFKGSRKANYVSITLNAMDTYDVVFKKINMRTFDVKQVDTLEGAYNDMLSNYFEQTTGLYLSF